jgi:hypothetical protein
MTLSRFGLPVALLLPALAWADGPRSVLVPPRASRVPAVTSVTFDPDTQIYRFRAVSQEAVTYAVDLSSAEVSAGRLSVQGSLEDGAPVTVVTAAGLRWMDAPESIMEPQDFPAPRDPVLVSHGEEAGVVTLQFQETLGGAPRTKTYRLYLAGTTLVAQFQAPAALPPVGYVGVSLGWADGVPGARVVQVPYMPEPLVVLGGGAFLTAYVERTTSSATSFQVGLCGPDHAHPDRLCAHSVTTMDARTDGTRVDLEETAYITLSADAHAVFPEPTTGPSPYRSSLSHRVVADVWGQEAGFGPPEGVRVQWSPAPGEEGGASVSVTARHNTGATCGDGTLVRVHAGSPGGAVLGTARASPGEQAPHVITGTLPPGESLLVDVWRITSNSCDGTELRVTVTTPSGTRDSVEAFGPAWASAGFSALELVAQEAHAMTWNGTDYVGEGAYSIVGHGFVHPGSRPYGRYALARVMMDRYAEAGLQHLAWIFHDWQHWGYDDGLPQHHPCNPAYGTGTEFSAMVADATSRGHLFALHEQYTDIFPPAEGHPSPLYREDDVARDSANAMKTGWYNESTGVRANRAASHRMRALAESQSPLTAADYHPNATYLDVTPGWSPAMGIDMRASAPVPPTLAAAYRDVVSLFQFMRATYQGPLFGEGGEGWDRGDTYLAGHVDAVERQTEGHRANLGLPDYELMVVKPRQFNHGMGYHNRYFVPGNQASFPEEERDVLQYRASQVLFGHAGFLESSLGSGAAMVREHAVEYWLTQALQSLYADATTTAVAYEHLGAWLDLEGALDAGLDLAQARVRVDYDNGLTLLVNRSSPVRVTSTNSGFSFRQGDQGFSYLEADLQAETLRSMTWNRLAREWRGTQRYSIVSEGGAHPGSGLAAVRTWLVPGPGALKVRGTAKRGHTAPCGDGVTVSVRLNGTVLWEQAILPNDFSEHPYTATFTGRGGDVVEWWVVPGATNECDGTSLDGYILWDDGLDHAWSPPGSDDVIPPSGFLATGPAGFLASHTLQAGRRVEEVRSPGYSFVRVLDGALATVGEVTLDGALARVPGAGGAVDLHGLALTTAATPAQTLVTLSLRGDVNVQVASPREVLLAVRGTEGPAEVDVTLGMLPPGWVPVVTAHPADLELRALDDHGAPSGEVVSVSVAAGPVVVMPGLQADTRYRLRLTSACVADAECLHGSCVGGRCQTGADAGGPRDAATGADGAPPPPDAGTVSRDGSVSRDAALSTADAGEGSRDAAVGSDGAASLVDASGNATDAGARQDAASGEDAGAGEDAAVGTDGPANDSCACSGAGNSLPDTAWFSGALGLLVWRRVRKPSR